MSDPLIREKLRAMRDLIDERDRLYIERDVARSKAVDAALAAVKEQTKASFDASEKAIVKAEQAQHAYNQSHNDLAHKMDEQNKATMPRSEAEARFKALENNIAGLRESRSTDQGRSAGGAALWGFIVAGIAILIALATLALRFVGQGG